MALFSIEYGYLFLAVYGITVVGVTFIFGRGRKQCKREFLLANESVNPIMNGISVAATWTWAPALFVASQQAYLNGIAGAMWFLAPNVLCLIIFAWFARRMRDYCPSQGYSISSYVRERFHSPRLQFLYLMEISVLSTCSFSVQLLAGGSVLAEVTGIQFWIVVALMSLIALVYSASKGLRASVVTDVLQLSLMLSIVLVLVPWCIVSSDISLSNGWNGINKVTGALDLNVFLTFGLATTIGLLSGPYGDQSFWQRVSSVKQEHVFSSFTLGAAIFAIIPTLMSLLGFLGAASTLSVPDPQLVNISVISAYLPAWTLVPFIAVILSGLGSTLDSMLSAMASITAHDFFNNYMKLRDSNDSDKISLRVARIGMCLMAIVSCGMSNIPGLKILHLFLIYGALRATVFLPTVMALISSRIHERGLFYGIVLALCIGWPLFIYGQLTNQWPLHVLGTLLEITVSGGVCALTSWWLNSRGITPPPMAVTMTVELEDGGHVLKVMPPKATEE